MREIITLYTRKIAVTISNFFKQNYFNQKLVNKHARGYGFASVNIFVSILTLNKRKMEILTQFKSIKKKSFNLIGKLTFIIFFR